MILNTVKGFQNLYQVYNRPLAKVYRNQQTNRISSVVPNSKFGFLQEI